MWSIGYFSPSKNEKAATLNFATRNSATAFFIINAGVQLMPKMCVAKFLGCFKIAKFNELTSSFHSRNPFRYKLRMQCRCKSMLAAPFVG